MKSKACTPKVSYSTVLKAKAALRTIRCKPWTAKIPKDYYECETCGFYHLTSGEGELARNGKDRG